VIREIESKINKLKNDIVKIEQTIINIKNKINYDDIKTSKFYINHQQKRVFMGEREIYLTPNEFYIFEAVYFNSENITTFEELTNLIGYKLVGNKYVDDFTKRNVSINVCRINKKLGKKYIKSKIKIGYFWTDNEVTT